MNNIAKCWTFEVLFFDNFCTSSESVTSWQGYMYVGYDLSLVFECVYTVKSRLICLVRMLCSVHGTSEDQRAVYCA